MKNSFQQNKLLFLLIVLILTPIIVAILKRYSPINCPNNIKLFGGGAIYISTLDIFNADIFFAHAGKCFPAGHASGGFSLISLYFVMPTIRTKIYALCFALTLGWIMGLYQIAKGAHYLSDTIVTLSIACIISLIMQRLLLKKANS